MWTVLVGVLRVLVALGHHHTEMADDAGPLAPMFDDYDDLAAQQLNRHPHATMAELWAWIETLPYIHGDRGWPAASVAFPLADDQLVFVWRDPEGAPLGGGGRASVFVRGRSAWRKLGSVDADDDVDGFRLAAAQPSQRWFMVVNDYAGNGAPPSRGIVVAAERDGLRVIRTDEATYIRERPDGAVVERFGRNFSTYPFGGGFLYRWRITRHRGALAFRETPLTPWFDALDTYCGAHFCANDIARVARAGDRATVRLDDGDPDDAQTFTLRRRGAWRVMRCRGRCD